MLIVCSDSFMFCVVTGNVLLRMGISSKLLPEELVKKVAKKCSEVKNPGKHGVLKNKFYILSAFEALIILYRCISSGNPIFRHNEFKRVKMVIVRSPNDYLSAY